jgi:hypothetical protein
MKTLALLALASAQPTYCDITIKGTRSMKIPFQKGTFDATVFQHTFTDIRPNQVINRKIPLLRFSDKFHYVGMYGCADCTITVPNLGKPGMTELKVHPHNIQSIASQYPFPLNSPIVLSLECRMDGTKPRPQQNVIVNV